MDVLKLSIMNDNELLRRVNNILFEPKKADNFQLYRKGYFDAHKTLVIVL